MTAYSTVLFDLDGTLTDPGVGIIRSITHALETVGRPIDDRQSLRHLIGPPLVEGFSSLGLDADEVDGAIRAYRERYAEIGLFENELIADIEVLLGDLATHGVTMAVATSKPEPSTVVMVGDREHDVFGAIENDVAAIGVLWGYGSRTELSTAGATAIAATVDDLRDLLL
jgi:phosphoglycolate phosphatase